MDKAGIEKWYKENCMVVYKANPDIRNGISKLKVIELKKEFKIGELYFNKKYLFQKLIDEFEKELILNRWDSVYFPLRETEEDAKEDLFKFVEFEIIKYNEEIKKYNEKLKRLNYLRKVAGNELLH